MRKVSFLLVVLLLSAPAFASETIKGAQKDLEAIKTKVTAEADAARARLDAEIAAAKEENSDLWKRFKQKLSASVDNLNTKIQNALKE